MATFVPILSDRTLNYAYNRVYYRNQNREAQWGQPVYFAPYDRPFGQNGFGGPRYEYGYNYNTSPETAGGNCTWWCAARLREVLNVEIMSLMNWASPNAVDWYNNFTGNKSRNANNASAGDIIVFSTNSPDGHVMFIEKIENGVIYISHSAWSYRSYWTDYACRVNNYLVSEIYQGNTIDMYKGTGNPYSATVVGVLHTGGSEPPTPPEPPTTNILSIIITKFLRTKKKFTAIKKDGL